MIVFQTLIFVIAAVFSTEDASVAMGKNVQFLYNVSKFIKLELIPFFVFIIFCMTKPQWEDIKKMLCCKGDSLVVLQPDIKLVPMNSGPDDSTMSDDYL